MPSGRMRLGRSDCLACPDARQVLVVDDSRDTADSLARLLRFAGHQVQVAFSSSDALPWARQHEPVVILLDIGMPQMDGYRVARQLRQQPETKDALIIAVTGYAQESDRQRSKDAGFDLKPINAEKLLSFLQGDPALLLESAIW